MNGKIWYVTSFGLAVVVCIAALGNWHISNPPSGPKDFPYNDYIQAEGQSENKSGTVGIEARASPPPGEPVPEPEISTTLMTDASGDFSGGIGDGEWDWIGAHLMMLRDELPPNGSVKAARQFNIVVP